MSDGVVEVAAWAWLCGLRGRQEGKGGENGGQVIVEWGWNDVKGAAWDAKNRSVGGDILREKPVCVVTRQEGKGRERKQGVG